MKLPSFQYLLQESAATLKRFPFVIINAVIGTSIAVYLIDLPYDQLDTHPALIKWCMVTGLGIALFTALAVWAEKKKLTSMVRLVVQGMGVLILVAYYFWLPATLEDAPMIHFIRYCLFAIGLHLLVAFAPFTGKGEINGFWQYNKVLFLRFLTAGLFSGVLYAGLCIALVASDKLLGIDIDGTRYRQLWVLMAGVFNTWFFLSGVPKDLDALENQTEYPKGLKIFTQFVLIPLVVIYLFILYLYTGKIMIEWQWPNGWVANLVLGFSITGILSLLLVYPIRERVENLWVRLFSKWYYVAIIPLIVLLTLSIWLRVSDYGITENRYFVIILGAWLTGIVLYMLIAKVQNIKLIPISLCALAFLTSFGPWSAFGVSRAAQLKRLESVMAKYNLLVDGKAKKVNEEVPFTDTKEISSITRYVVSTHGGDALQYLFDQNLQDIANRSGEKNATIKADDVVALLGLKYLNEGDVESSGRFAFNAGKTRGIKVVGYDHLLHINLSGGYDGERVVETYTVDSIQYEVGFYPARSKLAISRSDIAGDSLVIDLKPMIRDLGDRYTSQHNVDIPAERMRVELESQRLKTVMSVHSLNGSKHGQDLEITTVTGEILMGRK